MILFLFLLFIGQCLSACDNFYYFTPKPSSLISCFEDQCCQTNNLNLVVRVMFERCFTRSYDYDTVIAIEAFSELEVYLEGTNLEFCESALDDAFDAFCEACSGLIVYTREYYNIFHWIDEYLRIAVNFTAPVEWTCESRLYGDGLCHCNCGIVDPDCESTELEIAYFACNEYANSIGKDSCSYRCVDGACQARFIPSEFTRSTSCNLCVFGTGDGACNCGCGVPDPDCQTVSPLGAVGCDCDELCNEQSLCETNDNFISPPREWTCWKCSYNITNSGCNCGCGAHDPDCDVPEELDDCKVGFCSSVDGDVCVEEEGQVDDKSNWACDPNFFLDGICDCRPECVVWDPDCDDSSNTMRDCLTDEICYQNDEGYSECQVKPLPLDILLSNEGAIAEGYINLGIEADITRINGFIPVIVIDNDYAYINFSYASKIPNQYSYRISAMISDFFISMGANEKDFYIEVSDYYIVIYFFLYIPQTVPVEEINTNGYTNAFFIPIDSINSRYRSIDIIFPVPPFITNRLCPASQSEIVSEEKNYYLDNVTEYYLVYNNVTEIELSVIKGKCNAIFLQTSVEMSYILVDSRYYLSETTFNREIYSDITGSYFELCCEEDILPDSPLDDSILVKIQFSEVTDVFVDSIKIFARWYPFGKVTIRGDFGVSTQKFLVPTMRSLYTWALDHSGDEIADQSLLISLSENPLRYNVISVLLTDTLITDSSQLNINDIEPHLVINGTSHSPYTLNLNQKEYFPEKCSFDIFQNLVSRFQDTANDDGGNTGKSVMMAALKTFDEWQNCELSAVAASNPLIIPDQCEYAEECLTDHLISINATVDSAGLCEEIKTVRIAELLPDYPYFTVPPCIPNILTSENTPLVWRCLKSEWPSNYYDVVLRVHGIDYDIDEYPEIFYDELFNYLSPDPYYGVWETTQKVVTTIEEEIGQTMVLCEAVLGLKQQLIFSCFCHSDLDSCGGDYFAEILRDFRYVCAQNGTVMTNNLGGYTLEINSNSIQFNTDNQNCDFMSIKSIPKTQFETSALPALSSIAVSPQPDKNQLSTIVVDDVVVGEMIQDGFTISFLIFHDSFEEMEICLSFEGKTWRSYNNKSYHFLGIARLNEFDELVVITDTLILSENLERKCFNFSGLDELYFPVGLIKDWESPVFFSVWGLVDQFLYFTVVACDLAILIWTSYNFSLYVLEFKHSKKKTGEFWELPTFTLLMEIILCIIQLIYFLLLAIGTFERYPLWNSIFADIPYMIFQIIFSALVTRWIQIYHFSMKTESKEAKKITTIMIVMNIITIVLNVIFTVIYMIYASIEGLSIVRDCARETSLSPLILISTIYKGVLILVSVSLAVLFLVYCKLLWNTLSKSSSSKSKAIQAKIQRLTIVTIFIAIFLIFQATLNIVGGILNIEQLIMPPWAVMASLILLQVLPSVAVVYMFQKKSIIVTFDKKKRSATKRTRNKIEMDSLN